jgi:hypothetical protein
MLQTETRRKKGKEKAPRIIGDGGEEWCIPISRHLSCRRMTYKDSVLHTRCLMA